MWQEGSELPPPPPPPAATIVAGGLKWVKKYTLPFEMEAQFYTLFSDSGTEVARVSFKVRLILVTLCANSLLRKILNV